MLAVTLNRRVLTSVLLVAAVVIGILAVVQGMWLTATVAGLLTISFGWPLWRDR